MSLADSPMRPVDTPEAGNWRLDWPTSRGGRLARARLKANPRDFVVEEDLELPAANRDDRGNSGEHLCLRIEKTGDNTEYLARHLASLAGCRHFDVGFCGLKDRHAVTRQWFSIYRPGLEAGDVAFIERVSEFWPVLAACRQVRKLRRGDHSGNRFEITLRDVAGDTAAIEQALREVRDTGCPNYFGPQRFGRLGGNLDRAVTLDPRTLNRSGGRGAGRRGYRGKAGDEGGNGKGAIYFSAARSWLFNEVLAARVDMGNWHQAMDGEPGMPGAEANMSPEATGPLWGDGGTEAVSEQGQLEREVVAQHPQLAALFSATRMKPERRPLVLRPAELAWQWLAADTLKLTFRLAPGQYATTLLGDVFELTDASATDRDR